MVSMKRIHSITIKRMMDESPDTSWLGEYSDKQISKFSIDRAHSLDCRSQFGQKHYVAQVYDAQGEESHAASLPTMDAAKEWEAFNCTDDQTCEITEEDAECDCGELGEMRRNEYRYFNPSFNYVDKNGHALPGNSASDVRKYVLQDYERMESLHAGNWYFMGIEAVAKYSVGGQVAPVQTISSGGLWGIESDSDAAFLKETEQEQLAELREQLHAIGFSKRAISAAFKDVQSKEDY